MPSSSQPAAVFWRRRLVVAAGVIALVWLALQLLPDGGDAPAPTTTATAVPEPTAAAVTDGPTTVRLAAANGDCDPELVRVTPTVRPKQQNRGPVEIGLVISTTAESSCTLQPDDADLVAIISANDKAVWDSTVCRQSLLTEPVQVAADWATLEVTTWSGRGSGASCSPKEGWATAGTYTVQAGTLGGEPGKTTFELLAAPKPSPTATKPTPTKSAPSAKSTTEPTD